MGQQKLTNKIIGLLEHTCRKLLIEDEIRHDLVAEVEAESAQADEEDLDEEDRALLGGKKKKAERR